ncbi:MAG: heparinase II/III family protein, partial [Phycisphaerae bacterium]|nr:heparinase II/III family protein [Phycisphaerae bacterium]
MYRYRSGALIALVCPVLLLHETHARAETEAAPSEPIGSVRRTHPRLMLLDKDLTTLRRAARKDPMLAEWCRSVHRSAEGLLETPPLEYRYGPRKHMLDYASQLVNRIYLLGLSHRLERNPRLVRRAIEELLAACRLESWNPSHFLDTAELTHGVAIGYDWFYRDLSREQRATLRQAICRRGLDEAIYFYDNAGTYVISREPYFNWAAAVHNWNQVCNGGMTVGALAVATEEPELAGRVLSAAMSSIRKAMAQYAPDGGIGEGPGYWSYATRYNVYFLASLETAVGHRVIEPFLQMPGFSKTGEFRIHMVGPTGLVFNFADAHENAGPAPEMFWLARQFKRPVYAWHAAQRSHGSPQDVIWYSRQRKSPRQVGLPLDAYFRHVEVVSLRSAWEDPNAVYVGFKGGDNTVNHGHLDLGSFVLDAEGQRWALDLGRDDYALPGYFIVGKTRYYRLKTEGHNTLIIDGRNQNPTARAPIVAFQSRPDHAFAVADLS